MAQSTKTKPATTSSGEQGHWATALAGLKSGSHSVGYATVYQMRDSLALGLDYEAFERLKTRTDTSTLELSKVIRIPQRTLARRKRFKPDESERILRVAAVFQRAEDVLGGIEQARRWFGEPARALGNKTPLEFCDTEPGAREVENLLGRIEHGVFS